MVTRQPMANRRDMRGFTLVEVLVVLVVIGILAALLLPVLVQARQNARMTPCISNLRQIGMAIRMYMEDHGGGRPIGFQPVYDGGYFRSTALLLCPADRTGNWGGIYFEDKRRTQVQRPMKDRPPAPPAETVRYSYLHPFTPDFADWEWKLLLEVENGNPGIAACQLHGRYDHPIAAWPPSILDYEGAVLRLQLDGAVIKKHVFWKVERYPGGKRTIANSTRFFSDTYQEAEERYLHHDHREASGS